MSLLEGKLLSRSYGPVQALDRVSFTLEPGEILGVAGESGCGKSTLLRLISGLEPPDTGKLLLRGQALSARRSRDQLRAVQLIFQDAAGSFHPRRRIADSIQDSVRSLLGRDSRADIPALCALVGLDPALARRYPRELSGGPVSALCHCPGHGRGAGGAAVRRDHQRPGHGVPRPRLRSCSAPCAAGGAWLPCSSATIWPWSAACAAICW